MKNYKRAFKMTKTFVIMVHTSKTTWQMLTPAREDHLLPIESTSVKEIESCLNSFS